MKSGHFVGRCVGGPLHGKDVAHWSNIKKMQRPLFDGSDTPRIVTAEYRLNDFGQWHWWPSKDWKAMDQLFGELND